MTALILDRDTTLLSKLVHPSYISKFTTWQKWRAIKDGGRSFVNNYLVQYTKREDSTDFSERKDLTYCPCFSKSTINDIKNSIQERLSDVVRLGGPESYKHAIEGKNGGVDMIGSSMNAFLGVDILPELLFMGKVGIFIDRPPISGNRLSDDNGYPYMYVYKREDILNWVVDRRKGFSSILLRDYIYDYDEKTGFPIKVEEQYRFMRRADNGVEVRILSKDSEDIEDPIMLDIPEIPFVLAEISESLLTDIAEHQISLMNLASSDMIFCQKSNFPFYTEQFDPSAEFSDHFIQTDEGDDGGESADAQAAKSNEIAVGPTKGRRYSKELERPGFIFPSPEPMKVSMQKQEQIKTEIRLLLNLTIKNLQSIRSSAESKIQDESSKQSGISTIGYSLETAERQIAKIWAQYEGFSGDITIKYPRDYSLKTEYDRRSEAKDLFELQERIPSKTYQKEIAKQSVKVLLGPKIENNMLDIIYDEINKAPNMSSNPKILEIDIERGLVSTELASELRGYPEGEVKKAQKEHGDRLARIANSQGKNTEYNAARGTPDIDPDAENSAREEKKKSRETDKDDVVRDKTRGKSNGNLY